MHKSTHTACTCRSIKAELTPSGSLGPLYLAFGLISIGDLAAYGGIYQDVDNTNFLSWCACVCCCGCMGVCAIPRDAPALPWGAAERGLG